jgi:hypothetical protein
MMDELVQELSQKTGLSQDKSQEVINVVMSHLKARLPAPLGNGLDSLMTGSPAGGESLADTVKSICGRGEYFWQNAVVLAGQIH